MGKRIDRAARNVFAAALLYLFFAVTLRSVWGAAACAFCAMPLLRKVLGGLLGYLPERGRQRARAQATLEAWVRTETAEAERAVRSLLARAYPGEAGDVPMALLLRHPHGTLDADALLDGWRGRTGERLLFVSTARASAEARACAATLTRPAVRLMDGAQLAALLEKYPDPETAGAPAPPRRRLRVSPSRERAPRRLLFGLLLLATYALLNNPLYLAAALLTLLLAGLGWKKPPVPGRLFD